MTYLLNRGTDWPRKNAGVMVVFCITFLIPAGLISLFVYRGVLARRARRQALHQVV